MSQNFYYDQMNLMLQPMREELTRLGFVELRTAEAVDQAMLGPCTTGTTLVVVNSVCGCAAGMARPSVALSLQHDKLPDHLYTVFAGQDKEATAQMRSYFPDVAPSSPSFMLLKEGKLVYMIPREKIEGYTAEEIACNLTAAFDEHCGVGA